MRWLRPPRSFGAAAQVSIGLDAHAEDVTGAGIAGWGGGGAKPPHGFSAANTRSTQALLPSEFSAVAELEVGPFAEAVKRVALVAERNTPIRLAFTADGLTLEAGAGDEATASETVEASFDGEDLRVNFNPGTCSTGWVRSTPTRPGCRSRADPARRC